MTINVKDLQYVINKSKLSVTSRFEALLLAKMLMLANEFELNKELSERAGYSIYTAENSKSYICDLGSSFECNFENGTSKRIWIEN